MRSLQKISTRLRGTNFCTTSDRFVLSFVRQPNGPECTQIVRNTRKCQFRVQWGGSGALVAKNSDATSWHELLHYFGSFCTEFRKQPYGHECTQIVQNTPKRYFRVQWGIRCVRCEKFRRDFVARTFALLRPVLHRVS